MAKVKILDSLHAAIFVATLVPTLATAQHDHVNSRRAVPSIFVNPSAPFAPAPAPAGPVPYSQIGVDLNGRTIFVGTGYTAGNAGPARMSGMVGSFSPAGFRVDGYASYTCNPGCTLYRMSAAGNVFPWDDYFNNNAMLNGCDWNGGWGFCSRYGSAMDKSGHLVDYSALGAVSGAFFDYQAGDANRVAIKRRAGADGRALPVFTVGVLNAYGARYWHRIVVNGLAEFVAGEGRTNFTHVGGRATLNPSSFTGAATITLVDIVGSWNYVPCADGSYVTPGTTCPYYDPGGGGG
jgi:hypothetical protein